MGKKGGFVGRGEEPDRNSMRNMSMDKEKLRGK